MYKATPSALFTSAPSAPTDVHSCTIVDAGSLLYQPAVRAAVVQEQVALLTTRLALARWTSGSASPRPSDPQEEPFRAAFYARAQHEFLAWIARGGVWENNIVTGSTDDVFFLQTCSPIDDSGCRGNSL